MNFAEFFGMLLSLLGLNALLFFAFKKYILKQTNPAMKFFIINSTKDILWCIFWLANLEREKPVFFSIVIVFLVASLLLYYHIIRSLNKI